MGAVTLHVQHEMESLLRNFLANLVRQAEGTIEQVQAAFRQWMTQQECVLAEMGP